AGIVQRCPGSGVGGQGRASERSAPRGKEAAWAEQPPRFPRLNGSAMIDRGKARHLVGETIRDVGILVLVFDPLDALFQRPAPGAVLAPMVAGALSLVTLGIIVEAWEQDT